MPQTRKSTHTFKQRERYSPRTAHEKGLIKALAQLKTEKDAAAFIRDLMTPQEIDEFAHRLEIARLLYDGHSYVEIAETIGVSTTTVTRVAHWLYSGCGGYWKFLNEK